VRTGIGYDSHAFAEGRRLILGGVEIDHPRGLSGHSDADVVTHAIADALLGAAALGDIGTHFPPGDDRWKDVNSLEILGQVVELLANENYQTVNVDATVVCESPRLAPWIPAMRERIAAAIGIAPHHVSVKAKTNEHLGFVGRGEGIAALAIALVTTVED
jgi:2-C-methyl-D-erythritol 2,4-cyclodiphosphate synthase